MRRAKYRRQLVLGKQSLKNTVEWGPSMKTKQRYNHSTSTKPGGNYSLENCLPAVCTNVKFYFALSSIVIA